MNMYRYVTKEEFPDGLACMLCGHIIEEGQLYRASPYAMYDGVPVTELVHWENECE